MSSKTNNERVAAFNDRAIIVYLLMISSALCFVYLCLSFFSFPGADDFCQLGERGRNPFPTVVAAYMSWTGRYTSVICWGVFGAMMDIVADYYVCGLFHIGATLLGMWAFTSSLLTRRLFSRSGVIPALLLFSAFVAGIPTTYEAFYWVSGSIPYQLALVFSCASAAFMLWDPGASRIRNVLKYSGIVGSSLLGAGCNEIPSILFLGAMLIAILVRWITCRDFSRYWNVTALLWLVGTIILIAAPGNYRRLEHFSQRHLETSWVFLTWAFFVLDQFFNWLLNGANLCLVLLLVPFVPEIRRRYDFLKRIRWVHLLVALSVWLSFIAVGAAPLFLVSQFDPPARVANVLFFYFLLGLLMFVVMLVSCLINSRNLDFSYDKRTQVVVLVFLTYGLLLSPQSNFPAACGDLFFRAAPFHRQQMARLALVKEAKGRGETTVVIPPLNSPPATLHGYNLADWSWIANAYAQRFGVERVIVAEPGRLNHPSRRGSRR